MLVLDSSGNILYPQQSSPPRLAMSSLEQSIHILSHYSPQPYNFFSYATTRKHHHG